MTPYLTLLSISIYIMCVYVYERVYLGGRFTCRHILSKTTDKSFSLAIFVHECDLTNEDESCLIIVRNLRCYDSNTSTFDLPWLFSRVCMRSRHRL